jgi:hypothetical protein
MHVDRIVRILHRRRLPVGEPLAVLQEAVALILREEGVPFYRRHVLTTGFDVDFFTGFVGIEVRCEGSALQHAQHITRLAEAPELSAVLVIVTRERLAAIQRWIPMTLTKPVHVFLARR